MNKLILLIMISLSVSAYSKTYEGAPIDIDAYVDPELMALKKDTNLIKNRAMNEKKKLRLSDKRSKYFRKFLPLRAKNLKGYSRFKKLNAISKEYFACISAQEEDCSEYSKALEAETGSQSKSVQVNPIFIKRLNQIREAAKEGFPNFKARFVVNFEFDEKGNQVYANVMPENSYLSINSPVTWNAVGTFLQKYKSNGTPSSKNTKVFSIY